MYLADLGGEPASLTEKLWEADSVEVRIGILERWLLAQIRQYFGRAECNKPFIHTRKAALQGLVYCRQR